MNCMSLAQEEDGSAQHPVISMDMFQRHVWRARSTLPQIWLTPPRQGSELFYESAVLMMKQL